MGINVSTSQKVTLERSGDAPLTFSGVCLTQEACEYVEREGKPPREFYLSVYVTDTGKFVVSLLYRTEWDREADIDMAFVCSDAAEVRGKLKDFSSAGLPAMPIGYPQEEKFSGRQAELIRGLRLEFDEAVTRLLALPEFHESV